MFDIHWWLNFASFIGIATLSVPVWSLNSRRKRLQDLRDADRTAASDSEFRSSARSILIDRRKTHVEDWRRIDEICLAIGYTALFGSTALRLFFPAA